MNDTIIFRISKEFKEQLVKEAKEKDLTLTAYIKSILSGRSK